MLPVLLPLLLAPAAPAADRRTPVVLAVERATPAVVTVQVEVERQNPFWGYGSTLGASEGSGVVIDAGGVVLTNAHVVQGARAITVRTSTDAAWPAQVVALDTDLDLAVLQVEGAPALPTIPIGDSDRLMLGETTIAIGNPLGLGLTVSTGVVGSVDRDLETRPGMRQSFIQTDAAINPGNSGGALVNLDGALIGINTAIRADAEGIGFAIPVNRAMKIARDLVQHGTVQAPWLGLEVVDLDARSLRGTPIASGAVRVDRITAAGPAASGGLKVGDLLVDVDGHPVASRSDLNARLAAHAPGDRLQVGYWREGKKATATLTGQRLPDDAASTALASVVGIGVTPATGGLLVSRATREGSWTASKLVPGDLIVAVDGRRVATEKELLDAVGRALAQHRGVALFTVRRGPYQGHVALPLSP